MFVYDLIRGLLRANGMDDVFEKHFAPRESGGTYFEITSDDGSVTCYFHYTVGQEGPPVQVTGIDVFTFVRTDEGWKLTGGVYSVIPVD